MLSSLSSLGVATDGGEAADAAQASKHTIMRALEREVRPGPPAWLLRFASSTIRYCSLPAACLYICLIACYLLNTSSFSQGLRVA